MINYETLMLARTEITDDELRALERHFDKLVADQKGRITLFDRWGKYKLAYPVQKNMYGIYLLARYTVPSEQVTALFKEIDTLFRIKYNELVMRHVTMRLEPGTSTIYKYPEAIGSRGTSDLGSFIKENKMEGLIDTPTPAPEAKLAPEAEEGAPEVVAGVEDQETKEAEEALRPEEGEA
ncbi:30S ribosomal protein S6 [Candidatus Dependentiae bacterium]|nr:30S ribosomal protein S6 [Candidatus Dependentiae bacterium]